MKRKLVQALTALATNAYIPGWIKGRIYRGPLKNVCVPGLGCYSCPGALGSCPIGSLQAVIGSYKYRFSYYIVGTLALFGLVFGRFICGFLCPFGLIQELLHKIPFPRVRKPWRWPRYIKYGVLAIFVLWMPAFATGAMGIGDPAFCKYICPAGTLTAGFPLVGMNPQLQSALGWLFGWKVFVLALVILGSMVIYRFFCRYLCPLGAIYALFNRFSLYQLHLCQERCTHCGACSRACRMDVNPAKQPKDPECIRCGDCVRACKFGALRAGFSGHPVRQEHQHTDA